MPNNIIHKQDELLHEQLKTLLLHARDNEKKLRRLHSLELLLIGASSMFELIQMLLNDYRDDFAHDVVSLVLIDHDYEIQHILEDEGVELEAHPSLIFSTTIHEVDKHNAMPLFPLLASYKPRYHASLFPEKSGRLRSVALLPLVRHGRFIGSLNLGSKDPRRFDSSAGTDLLERLAGIVAICLENSLNYERLKRTGLTDGLTAVNNRRFFDQRLIEEVDRSRRNLEPLSCLFIDIDYFKSINDNYGHACGDDVLKKVARLINAQMRRSDVLARYGGEEFAVLLSNTEPQVAEEIAERIRMTIENFTYTQSRHEKISVTVSIGVSTFYPHASSSTASQEGALLLDNADMALLHAKGNGRNRVTCHQQTMVV